jgi:hypothetical protein
MKNGRRHYLHFRWLIGQRQLPMATPRIPGRRATVRRSLRSTATLDTPQDDNVLAVEAPVAEGQT